MPIPADKIAKRISLAEWRAKYGEPTTKKSLSAPSLKYEHTPADRIAVRR